MTSPNFAAALNSLLVRRQRLAAEAKQRFEPRQHSQISHALTRLPLPLHSLGRQAIEAWDVIKGREGTRPAFRVGQLDTELLDEELLELLKGQVGEGLKFLGVSTTPRSRVEIQ